MIILKRILEEIGIMNRLGKIFFAVPIIIVVIGFFMIAEPIKYHQYHRDIIRTADNDFEENLLENAEHLDFSSLLHYERYEEGETLSPNTDGYAQFIDGEVIQHYWDRIGHLRNRLSWGYCYMYYGANVHYLDTLHILIYETKNSEYSYSITMEPMISSLDPDINIPAAAMTTFLSHGQILIRNGKDFDILNGVKIGENDHIFLNQTFSDCYMVEMGLFHGRQEHSLVGSGFNLFQYVIYDKNGDLLMIGIWRIDWES